MRTFVEQATEAVAKASIAVGAVALAKIGMDMISDSVSERQEEGSEELGSLGDRILRIFS